VVLIIGITGACRRQELLNLKLNDVEDLGEFMKIMLPITKTKVPREFTVTKGHFKDLNLVDMVRKYATLRPSHTPHARFFINYKKGRCTVQPVGINTFGGLPSKIANFLELPSAKEYTGHCFRRTSASLLANAGADMSVIKRHGALKSSNVAEGYVDDSLENKKKICKLLVGGEDQENTQIEKKNEI
jgi:integrase